MALLNDLNNGSTNSPGEANKLNRQFSTITILVFGLTIANFASAKEIMIILLTVGALSAAI